MNSATPLAALLDDWRVSEHHGAGLAHVPSADAAGDPCFGRQLKPKAFKHAGAHEIATPRPADLHEGATARPSVVDDRVKDRLHRVSPWGPSKRWLTPCVQPNSSVQ